MLLGDSNGKISPWQFLALDSSIHPNTGVPQTRRIQHFEMVVVHTQFFTYRVSLNLLCKFILMDGIVVCSQLSLPAKMTAITFLCDDNSGFKEGHPHLLPINMAKLILSCILKFTY